jgi:hypothetical protein
MLFAPLEGSRHVEVTDRHTALDYPQLLEALSDRHFPAASKIVLVQDNPSTHMHVARVMSMPRSKSPILL